ncbi:MAG: valine--tRNA ligase [Candidatus Omnitrophica bacterium]|nr:valine--tRNA ligase [Candidatus Omnitrophota bacterium]MBU4477682.1 valine--tRNA ligase [Candidatus Omnitrophota bacterium]
MKEPLATKYSFKDIEEKHYRSWEENSLFHAGIDSRKTPFSIVIPPPNVTGILHMGHALNNTIQDILIRYKKMNGFEALWMPGTDHAGIATQNVVERKIAREGTSRQKLGREKFLERVWEWKQEYGSTIIRQLRSLGCACDWQRTRFTMDEEYSDAVLEVFVRLYEKKLIYRGNYIINWCPRCQTALADEEAPHKDVDGFLYHIKYPLKDSPEYVVVATTRPETMLGDTAVAVNPRDGRYQHLLGRTVLLPLMEREIPIIEDDFVDPEFGTGAVKVTPAHDPNDYAMGRRHNLQFINILHPDGRCNENAGDYAGSDRFEAREAILEDLKERRLLLKIEPHKHAVGHCYRCHTVIEPYLSKQWFVKMKPLSIPAKKAVEEGTIKFYPERWTKVYLNWMENIQDWCISRQIWWGHRIPAWYCGQCNPQLKVYIEPKGGRVDKDEKISLARFDIPLDEITVLADIEPIISKTKPCCPHCESGDYMIQDPQVLDTWFSSWLWPFATFGWPFNQKTEDRKQKTAEDELNYFYPTSVLVTAPEIIFFWVARMIMAGFEFMGDVPFRDVYIHGTVRDDTGKKMSKSLGNSIDPLDVIAEYGTDALRFSLISIAAMGQDVFLSKEKFEFGRNFCNKLWNASRFILMNMDDKTVSGVDFKKEKLALAEAWILSRFNSTLKNLNKALETYRLNEAAGVLYEFFWHQFCDWYIELAKLNIGESNTQAVLLSVLERSVLLLHPFAPFITEEIWQKVTPQAGPVMTQPWPQVEECLIDEKLELDMQRVIDVCVAVRNMRSENNIKPKEKKVLQIFTEDKAARETLSVYAEYLKRLANISELTFCEEVPKKTSCASSVVAGCQLFMPVEGLDVGCEKEKIAQQVSQLRRHISRKDSLLSNENYLKKAPPEVVEKEKQSRRQLQEELEKLEAINNALK